MEKLKSLAIQVSMNDALKKKSYFNICAVDNALKAAGIHCQDTEAYDTLHLLHCVDYSSMPKALRDSIPELILRCFGEESESTVAVEPEPYVETVREPVLIEQRPAGLLGFLKRG